MPLRPYRRRRTWRAGIVLQRARQGHSWSALEHDLNRRSGLLGLSGLSDDVRELLAAEAAGHTGARRALAAFCHRIHKYLGAYAAVLGDRCLGTEARISSAASMIDVHVIPVREEEAIARATQRCLTPAEETQ